MFRTRIIVVVIAFIVSACGYDIKETGCALSGLKPVGRMTINKTDMGRLSEQSLAGVARDHGMELHYKEDENHYAFSDSGRGEKYKYQSYVICNADMYLDLENAIYPNSFEIRVNVTDTGSRARALDLMREVRNAVR